MPDISRHGFMGPDYVPRLADLEGQRQQQQAVPEPPPMPPAPVDGPQPVRPVDQQALLDKKEALHHVPMQERPAKLPRHNARAYEQPPPMHLGRQAVLQGMQQAQQQEELGALGGSVQRGRQALEANMQEGRQNPAVPQAGPASENPDAPPAPPQPVQEPPPMIWPMVHA